VSDGLPPATTLRAMIGPYEVVKVLSSGDGENVYLAFRDSPEREVVVKAVAASETPHDTDRQAAVARHLAHRHILRILDAGEDAGLSYVVTESLHGRTLADHHGAASQTWDLATRIDLVAQLCVGLHFAHQHGLVHGDVKPANVFVTDDGVVKILNFGTALPTDLTMVSGTALSGSVEYLAPERLIGREPIDGRSDLFSAAVILYELVAGHRPFQGSSTTITLARIVRDEPTPIAGLEKLDVVIRRALEKDPSKRFASAQEFAFALWMLQLEGGETDSDPSAEPGETLYVEPKPSAEAQQSDVALPVGPLRVSRKALLYGAMALALVGTTAGLLLSC
jgi:serine/threonine-protein kinase